MARVVTDATEKKCPSCWTVAQIDQATCLGCGRVFKTQFVGNVKASLRPAEKTMAVNPGWVPGPDAGKPPYFDDSKEVDARMARRNIVKAISISLGGVIALVIFAWLFIGSFSNERQMFTTDQYPLSAVNIYNHPDSETVVNPLSRSEMFSPGFYVSLYDPQDIIDWDDNVLPGTRRSLLYDKKVFYIPSGTRIFIASSRKGIELVGVPKSEGGPIFGYARLGDFE